jgi:r1t holin
VPGYSDSSNRRLHHYGTRDGVRVGAVGTMWLRTRAPSLLREVAPSPAWCAGQLGSCTGNAGVAKPAPAKTLWVQAAERALKTFAQSLLAMLTGNGLGLLDVPWATSPPSPRWPRSGRC